MQDTWVRSLGREDPPEKEMATHSSILAWRIPWTEEPGQLQSIVLQRVGHDWTTNRREYGGQWEMNFINRDKAALGRIKVQAARPLLKKKMFYSYYMIKKYPKQTSESQQILKNNRKSHLYIHKEINLYNRNVATLWSSHTHYMFGNLEANLQVTHKIKNFVKEITKYLDSKWHVKICKKQLNWL